MSDCPDGFKKCSKCGECKPATREYFSKNKGGKYGLYSICLKCKSLYNSSQERKATVKNYNKSYRLRPDAQIRERERMNSAVRKEWERIYSRSETRKRYSRQYERSDRRKAARKEYRQTEKQKLYQREYETRPNRIAYRKSYSRTFRYRENQRRWIQSPKGRLSLAIRTQRRRARKQGLPDNYTQQDWLLALSYFDHRCAVCGRAIPDDGSYTLAADHWIPLADTANCPGTIPENMIPLCHGENGCNNSKSGRNAIIWIRQRYPDEAEYIIRRVLGYFEWIKRQ